MLLPFTPAATWLDFMPLPPLLVTLGLTLYSEGKTKRAIVALHDLTSRRALVIRDGKRERIAGREVVRGDLVESNQASSSRPTSICSRTCNGRTLRIS